MSYNIIWECDFNKTVKDLKIFKHFLKVKRSNLIQVVSTFILFLTSYQSANKNRSYLLNLVSPAWTQIKRNIWATAVFWAGKSAKKFNNFCDIHEVCNYPAFINEAPQMQPDFSTASTYSAEYPPL